MSAIDGLAKLGGLLVGDCIEGVCLGSSRRGRLA